MDYLDPLQQQQSGRCNLSDLLASVAPADPARRDAVRIRLMTRYVELADEVCAIAERMAADSRVWLDATGYERTFRDDVLTALCLKIDSSFRALTDDARLGRSETMHHLKTMVECFIFFHVVAADTSPETAKRLLAKAIDDKITFVR